MSDYTLTSNELAELFATCSPKLLSICVVIDCTDPEKGVSGSRVIAIQKDTIKTFLKQVGTHISGDKYKHQKLYLKNRYANDEEFRESMREKAKIRNKDMYDNNLEHKEKLKAQNRLRYQKTKEALKLLQDIQNSMEPKL